MASSLRLIPLLILCFLNDLSLAKRQLEPQPGFRILLTNEGLKYLASVGVPLLENQLKSLNFELIEDNYEIKNVYLEHFTIGSSSLTSSAEKGMTFRAKGVSLTISADWSYKILFGAIRDNGSVTASGSGVSLTLSILPRASEQGQLRITMTDCSFSVGDLSIKLHGGASYVYNFFINIFKKRIKRLLSDKICELARNNLTEAASKILNSPPVIKIDDTIGLSYALLQQPNFTSTYIMTDHEGNFASVIQPNIKAPFSPSPLPSTLPDPTWPEGGHRMAYAMVTEYMANTAALTYMRTGQLTYNVTADSIHDKGPFLRLDTTTISLLVPELYHRFSNQSLMLTIRAKNHPPKVTFTENGANFTVHAAMDVYVVCNSSEEILLSRETTDRVCDESMPLAVTFGIMATASARFWLNTTENSTTIMGNATDLKVDFSLLRSNVGIVNIEKITNFAKGLKIIEQIALPRINERANKGYTFPDIPVPGFKLSNPDLQFKKGYVVLGTDVAYNP